ncbi:family S53 protease-like protein [Favolaschia claudopus]|uniref:Family S53 protease-like protein n=1 Tax=Favolaschia claudopus TaxID=2862362 RepID=A0AAW0D175_9AGAR
MIHRSLTGLLAVLSVVSCTPFTAHERRQSPPPGFTNKGPAPDSEQLMLKFALTSNNLAGLEEKLVSISTPGNPDFRQWLSKEEVKSYVQPSNEAIDAFNNFVSTNGLTSAVISPNEDWMSLNLTVGAANKLFNADYQVFTAEGLDGDIIRSPSLSIPSELTDYVDLIHPGTAFFSSPAVSAAGFTPRIHQIPSRHLEGQIKRAEPLAASSSEAPCDVLMTPSCLLELYGLPSTPATQENNAILVTGYFDVKPNKTGLSTFLETFRADISPNTTYDLIQIADATNDTIEGLGGLQLEADLDVQYTIGLATDVPVQFLSAGIAPLNEAVDGLATSFLDSVMYLEGLDTPPPVVTTSYGPLEKSFDAAMARKICNSYMALGARGISMLFCFGRRTFLHLPHIFPGGVRGSHDDSSSGICESNDFLVVFPASCPYVTSVGSTSSQLPEVGTNFTGGGLTPPINDFLDTLPEDFPGQFNSSGRAYRTYQGRWLTTGGTSFSSPIFASIVALVNERLIEAGKPVLGFLNPWIYANQDAFTDITEGHNSGFECPTTSVAFNATKGWDPLTGKLLAAALKA